MEEIFPDIEPGQSLDRYIQTRLRPTEQEISRIHTAVDLFVRFLQKNFSTRPYTVSRVLKSGSLAKGTALHDCIDIDLVVFINGLKDIDDLMDERQTLKKRLIAEAEAFSKFQKLGLQTMRQTKFAAKFSLKGIELDVLPAFDALQTYEGKPRNIYRIMSKHMLANFKIGQEFSASLAPLQVAFIKYLRGDVKDYIRLVKHWKRVNDLNIPSYCLELLTVKVWRDMGGSKKRPRPVPTLEIFKKIIDQLADFDNIRVAFGTNYDVKQYIQSWEPPYIMDPANPNMNTVSRLRRSQREAVEEAARKTRHILNKIFKAMIIPQQD